MAAEPQDHPLIRVRKARNLERSAFARKLCDRSAELGTPLGTGRDGVLRWEKGRTPDNLTQFVIADLIGVDSALVESHPWPQWLQYDPLQQPNEHPWTGPGTVGALREVIGSPMDRRTFFLGSTAMTAALFSWLTADPVAAAQLTTGRRIGEGAVTTIERRVRELRLADDEDGGGTLIRDTAAALEAVTELLTNRSYTLAHQSRLYAAGADLARMRAWAAFDVNGRCDDVAFKAALQAAHAADDPALGAHILTFWAAAAYNCGRPVEAEALACTAVAAVRGKATPRVEALVLARRARARSHLRHEGCWSDLEASRAKLDAAERDRTYEPDWAYWFDGSEYAGSLASTQLAMGRADQAEKAFALSAREAAGTVRTQAIYLVRAADAQLQQGHVEGACATAHHALDITAEISSQRTTGPLRDLASALASYSHVPEAAEVRERISATI
ncbi:XRE family transcriptional regulator [Kitasatospora sp. NPDC092039]|uniref:XRE family transcriptional regulator n=1 Tax=Kitasatospora sp. NPDC092039 TaxID=3364086 RepID=UPI0038275F1A